MASRQSTRTSTLNVCGDVCAYQQLRAAWSVFRDYEDDTSDRRSPTLACVTFAFCS